MKFLLDTNVVSETRKGENAAPKLVSWFASVDRETATVSVVTLFEIERGIRSMERRDPTQAAPLRRWMRNVVLPEYQTRALPLGAAIMLRCAGMHVPNRRPLEDSLIAATALEHGLAVVTRNTADFMPLGVDVIDPWG